MNGVKFSEPANEYVCSGRYIYKMSQFLWYNCKSAVNLQAKFNLKKTLTFFHLRPRFQESKNFSNTLSLIQVHVRNIRFKTFHSMFSTCSCM